MGTYPRHVLHFASFLHFLVLLFFSNSRILQTGNLQTGPNQFVESSLQEKFYKLDLTFLQTGFYKLVFYKLVKYQKTHTRGLQGSEVISDSEVREDVSNRHDF